MDLGALLRVDQSRINAVEILFELPTPWSCQRSGDIDTWTRPDSKVRVEVDALRPLPTDRQAWGERVLSRNLPNGGSVRQSEIINSVSNKGWPTTLVSTAALNAKGKAVESRITMFFEVVYFGASIAVTIPANEVARWEEEMRQGVIETILNIEPRFAGAEVANIAELWDVDRPTGAT